jgi:lysophospholipase L1-like esterase
MSKKKKLLFIIGIASIVIFATITGCFVSSCIVDKKEERELQQKVKEYYSNKLNKYQQENELYEDYEVDVAFLGDSLTDGYDLEKYYPEYLVVNRGISGETTTGLEKRLKVSLYDLKPKVAVMLIGANNMDTMFDNYENILQGMKENVPDTKIVLLSLTSMGGEHWGRKNQLAAYNNVKIKILADKYGYTYVDLYSSLFDITTGGIKAEYTTDGGHLTDLGYQKFTQTLMPVLEELLG